MNKIPVSVIVVTRNEEERIAACLKALHDFAEVWVVDSNSMDKTKELAEAHGARVTNFEWSGKYPKKRQWCLDMLPLAHDWVFFVDADEIVTRELADEIARLDFEAAGYFVKGRYIFNGRALRFGLRNNKLALIDRRAMAFPVVDDIGLPGMGEIEGHYQPIPKPGNEERVVGQLGASLLHDAYDSDSGWSARHQRYAEWERGMDERRAWPEDPRLVKRIFKALPFRPLIAFLHSYLIKLGFLDGRAGLGFALTRLKYYRMIANP